MIPKEATIVNDLITIYDLHHKIPEIIGVAVSSRSKFVTSESKILTKDPGCCSPTFSPQLIGIQQISAQKYPAQATVFGLRTKLKWGLLLSQGD